MPGFVQDASEFWPDHPWPTPDTKVPVRTGAPGLGSNELREILGIIIILIGTNSFPDI
jgi:hypothetical protein